MSCSPLAPQDPAAPVTSLPSAPVVSAPVLGLGSWLAMALCASCAEPPAPTTPEAQPSSPPSWFSSISLAQHREDLSELSPRRIEYTMAGGVALADLDGDSHLDLAWIRDPLAALRDAAPELCLVRGPLASSLRTATSECLALPPETLPMGLTVADLDGNGESDLYLSALGPDLAALQRAQGFELMALESSANTDAWTVSAAQLPSGDLYVGSYLERTAQPVECQSATGQAEFCGPASFPPAADRLFTSGLGQSSAALGEFQVLTEASKAPTLGVALVPIESFPMGFAVYVGNDSMENKLLQVGARGSAPTIDLATTSGVALNGQGEREGSMGIAVGDVDRDGRFDLLVTHFQDETNTLYLQVADGVFSDQTRRYGLGSSSLGFTGFGTALLDVDGDGWLDLFVANGAVELGEPSETQRGLGQLNQLYRNLDGERFELVSAQLAGMPHVETSRGVARGDLDDDGDEDLVVSNLDGPLRVFFNQVPRARGWLGIDLRLRDGRAPVLAVVRLVAAPGTAEEPPQIRRFARDGSYASASDPRVLFALPATRGDDGDNPEAKRFCVDVSWYLDDGSRGAERFCELAPERYHRLERGAGQAIE